MLRKIARNVARNRMKKAGYVRINKGNPSFFAQNWRIFLKRKKSK